MLDDGVDGLTVGRADRAPRRGRPRRGGPGPPGGRGLAAAGARVEEVSVPEVALGLSAYYLIAPAEASSNLARYDGVRYGLRVDAEDTVAMNTATRSAGFGAEVKRRIMLGTYALSAGYYDAYYGQALRVRTLIIEGFAAAYERFDVLLGPTTPTTAFPLGAKIGRPAAPCTSPTCAPSPPTWPVIRPSASPSAPGDDGLPVGVQLLGPALSEGTLFQVAAVVRGRRRPTPRPRRVLAAGVRS